MLRGWCCLCCVETGADVEETFQEKTREEEFSTLEINYVKVSLGAYFNFMSAACFAV